MIKNDSKYVNLYMEIVQLSRELGILASKINERYFSNTIKVASMVKVFEWIEEFIENYAVYLPEKTEEKNRISISKALQAFSQGNFKETLAILLGIVFKDPFLEINRRSLIIQSYYEINNHKDLGGHINNYIRYLRLNKKLTKNQKKPYIQFHQCLNKLYKLRAEISALTNIQKQEKINKLKIEIQSKNIINKAWLLEKIKEL